MKNMTKKKNNFLCIFSVNKHIIIVETTKKETEQKKDLKSCNNSIDLFIGYIIIDL